MVGELPRKLAVQLVPARHVMNQHYPGKGSGTQWSGIVGVDYLSIMARQHNGLGKHSLIHVSRIRMHSPSAYPWTRFKENQEDEGLRSVNSFEMSSLVSRGATTFHISRLVTGLVTVNGNK